LSMSELLAPAIRYAEDGIPMDHVKHALFGLMLNGLRRIPGGRFFLDGDKQKLGEDGPRVVYEGAVAERIAETVHQAGGVMSTQDLSDHLSSTEPLEVEPASTTHRGDVQIHTTPLPTQGGCASPGLQHLPGQFEHVIIEALRQAMRDGLRYIGDPATGGSLEVMLSHKRAQECADMVKMDRYILRSGGNAADAAVAMAACMQVLQPYGSGLGGDCFALYYNAHEKQVHCVDGR
ncbi:hypothetical protein MTO96_044046, partial [Rhipicephalus appendiculatus]